jgi:hypothetical protein
MGVLDGLAWMTWIFTGVLLNLELRCSTQLSDAYLGCWWNRFAAVFLRD